VNLEFPHQYMAGLEEQGVRPQSWTPFFSVLNRWLGYAEPSATNYKATRSEMMKDERFEHLMSLANSGGDAAECAIQDLWLEYSFVYGRDEA